MNTTMEKQPHEVQLALPPYRVSFFGCIHTPTDEDIVSSGTEDGEPVETVLVGKLDIEIQKDGRWENIETSEHGTIEPGAYTLTSTNLFSVPDNQAVFDRPR